MVVSYKVAHYNLEMVKLMINIAQGLIIGFDKSVVDLEGKNLISLVNPFKETANL